MHFLSERRDPQYRTASHATESCFVHDIDNTLFHSVESVPLPLSMTSKRQPFDAAVGRSYSCASRRLSVDHLLTYVECSLAKSAHEQRPLKLSQAVRAFDALRLMKQA